MKTFPRYIYPLIAAALLLCGCSSEPALEQERPAPQAFEKITADNIDQLSLLRECDGHSKRVLDLSFARDGAILATSSEDLQIKIWDPALGQEMYAFPMTSVDMADIEISPGGDLLASGEAIWDLASREETLILLRGSPLPAWLAFSPDGSSLALAPLEEETSLWDLEAGEAVFAFPKMEEPRSKRMEFSQDGTLLAEAVIDGTIRVWDVEQAELVHTLHHAGETDIHDICFSPDGAYLANAGRLPRVVVWDVVSGEVVQRFQTRDNMNGVAFSVDSKILAASAGAEKAVLLWDVESGRSLGSLPLGDQSMALAFSPDGRWLAAGTFGGRILIWGIPVSP